MGEALRATGTFNDEAVLLRRLKDKLDEINADLKVAEAEYKEQVGVIIDLMREQGINSTKILGVATLTLTQDTTPVAEDWGQIYEFIIENNMAHILQRRLSSSAIDELEGSGIQVPGVGKFTKFNLSVRKA